MTERPAAATPEPIEDTITPLISTLTFGGRIFARAMSRITVEGAIDEMLRYYPPVNRTARLCVEDIPLRGKVIKKGQIVVLMLGAGNRDPSEYPDPDRFDITRENRSKPLSFGGGHHFCIGSHLARMEGEVALGALLQRMPNLRLATQEVEWRGNSRFRGLKALPVSF